MSAPADTVLEVSDLRTHFVTSEGTRPAVDGVSFHLERGRTLALVGESGCGKSITSTSILRIVPRPGRIVGGRIVLHARDGASLDLAALPENDPRLFDIRGGRIGMIFQEPTSTLSPVHTIGSHLIEALQLHQAIDDHAARQRAIEMLHRVGISAPERRIDQYPHELSGGMKQRVGIAIALICRPEVVIADEPTTALDVTIQAQVLQLLKELQREIGCAVLLITHDLGVVAQTADDVAVMYLGRIVEYGPLRRVLRHPLHPYTRGLLRSIPSLNRGRRLYSIPGTVPSLAAIPPGCPFHPRCEYAQPGRCDVGARPDMRLLEADHRAACLRADEVDAPPIDLAIARPAD